MTADRPATLPSPADPVSKWFRPRTSCTLRGEAVLTLDDLVNRRGEAWWRFVPRIGEKRAQVMVALLKKHAGQLGEVAPAPRAPLPSPRYTLLDPATGLQLLQLDRFYLPNQLAGGMGLNHSPSFCFIGARDDLAAVECYLARFEG